MLSFKQTFVAVAIAFSATASAQEGYYDIDLDKVEDWMKDVWCRDQELSCPAICAQTSDGEPMVNTCDADHLTYGCICSDGKKPNMTEYSLTLPYHVCTTWGNQCVEKCGLGANQCAADCREQHPCGATNPQRVNVTSSSATPDPTASKTGSADDGIFTGMDGDASASEDNDSAAAGIFEATRAMGLAAVVGGLFGAFALVL